MRRSPDPFVVARFTSKSICRLVVQGAGGFFALESVYLQKIMGVELGKRGSQFVLILDRRVHRKKIKGLDKAEVLRNALAMILDFAGQFLILVSPIVQPVAWAISL